MIRKHIEIAITILIVATLAAAAAVSAGERQERKIPLPSADLSRPTAAKTALGWGGYPYPPPAEVITAAPGDGYPAPVTPTASVWIGTRETTITPMPTYSK